MRHRNHRFQLGVKKEHREALVANLAVALITHERIQTTLTKAKALRPFIERIITLACKASRSERPEEKLHYRRLAISRVRDPKAVARLFDELAEEFVNRNGGYTRIYKLLQRRGDAAPMALIEFVKADDEGYKKKKRKSAKSSQPAPRAKATVPAASSESNAEEEQKAE